MELRSKTLFVVTAAILNAQSAQVWHDHLRGGAAGTLTVTGKGVVFEESGKKSAKHSRAFSYGDIQQLELTPDHMKILTYRDSKWKAGRDVQFEYEKLPADFAEQIDPVLRSGLGQKYVAALAETSAAPLWRIPAKLHERFAGNQGVLSFTGDRLVYSTSRRVESRTWAISDIESVSTSGRYELNVATLERSGWTRGLREFRFQLKTPLSDADYQLLWKAVNKGHGLNL